ncbi:MAG: glycosyltransferase family 1 protein [Candidatus Gracilibacteria bacterium]|jgi:glycosyltransferase involved in cell wall biosynthesis
MKKIIIITDAWSKNISGVVSSIYYIKKGLKKKGFKVFIIHPRLFKSVPLPTYAEIRAAIFPKRKMEKMIKQINPDYIHIATEGPLGYYGLKICVKNKWKFTTSYHTRLPEYIAIRLNPLPVKKLAYSYMRWFHSKSEKVMVTTPSLKEELEKRKFKNIVSFPLGINLKLFKKNPKAKIPEGLKKPIFTFLGRLAPEKNIKAFLKCKLPGSKLIIGDGPQKEELFEKFKDKAMFVGFKKWQDIVNLLSISDVFVFPSKTDTFGLVIIEALACELPIAAYNVQGPKDIIANGVNGYIGPDLEANAKKCLKLNKKKCRESSMKYSWENYASNFIKNIVHI